MIQNLFHNIPPDLPEELFEVICRAPGLRVERILSRGHASPPDFWYDQEENELVFLLQGQTVLQVEGEASPRTLRPGDYLNLPAHCKHRVNWTDPHTTTVWLAVFY